MPPRGLSPLCAGLAVVLFLGCGWEEAEVQSNGLDGQLYAFMVDGSSRTLPAALPLAVGAEAALCIERRLELSSGNGLGDATRWTEVVAWDVTHATVNVSPPSLVRITRTAFAGTCLEVALWAGGAGQGTLSVQVDSFSDQWTVSFQ